MTSTPQVSVIMNVRNGAANLSEAIESVLAQTFSDWELIFWDDRSTDDSARIAAGYEDARIRYFLSPEDAPLGRVRDMAIRQAQGEWLAFLDQDDLWMPDKLEKQMALARMDCQVGIVYGRTLTFSTRGFERDYDHRYPCLCRSSNPPASQGPRETERVLAERAPDETGQRAGGRDGGEIRAPRQKRRGPPGDDPASARGRGRPLQRGSDGPAQRHPPV